MMHPILYSEKQRLDTLFSRLKEFLGDEELAAHWSRYLCVLLSGFIENTMRILLTSFAKEKSHPYISNFVAKNLSSITNLNEQRIQQVLGSFSESWRQIFEKLITDEQKDAVNSVLANRHSIVHGRSVGISPVRITEYYKQVLQIVDMIETDCITR